MSDPATEGQFSEIGRDFQPNNQTEGSEAPVEAGQAAAEAAVGGGQPGADIAGGALQVGTGIATIAAGHSFENTIRENREEGNFSHGEPSQDNQNLAGNQEMGLTDTSAPPEDNGGGEESGE